jgi:hypothetical protein
VGPGVDVFDTVLSLILHFVCPVDFMAIDRIPFYMRSPSLLFLREGVTDASDDSVLA